MPTFLDKSAAVWQTLSKICVLSLFGVISCFELALLFVHMWVLRFRFKWIQIKNSAPQLYF